jgi:ribonuclease HI
MVSRYSLIMQKSQVTIYSDGGADPNPGPGGWGVVLLFTDPNGNTHKKELKGGELETTNNRMELTAAIQALRALKHPCDVQFYTDSQYVKKGITEWMANWKKTDFKKGKIQNADLWKTLDNEVARHAIRWNWVKGHAGNEYNELADTLATAGRAQIVGIPISETTETGQPSAVHVYLAVSAGSGTESLGPGAWATLIEQDGKETTLAHSFPNTAANRLYLLAAIAALETLPNNITIEFMTNSSYLREGMNGWIKGWKKNNWQTKSGGEVKHRDLWETLDELSTSHQVKWTAFDGTPPQTLTDALAEALNKAKQGQE